jgi:antitoxin (DNA-binding transcriptional repressor) of toxin-antitoxin stability system
VQKTGEPVMITKRGKPAAMLIRVSDEIFGYMSGKVKVVGDTIRATTPTQNWENK